MSALDSTALKPLLWLAIALVFVTGLAQRATRLQDPLLTQSEARQLPRDGGDEVSASGELPAFGIGAKVWVRMAGSEVSRLRWPTLFAAALTMILAAWVSWRLQGALGALLTLLLLAWHGPIIESGQEFGTASIAQALGLAILLSLDGLVRSERRTWLPLVLLVSSAALGMATSWVFWALALAVILDLWHRALASSWRLVEGLRTFLVVTALALSLAPLAVAARFHLPGRAGPGLIEGLAGGFLWSRPGPYELPAGLKYAFAASCLALLFVAWIRDTARANPEPPLRALPVLPKGSLRVAIGLGIIGGFMTALPLMRAEPSNRFFYLASTLTPLLVWWPAHQLAKRSVSVHRQLNRLPRVFRRAGSPIVRPALLALVFTLLGTWLLGGRPLRHLTPLLPLYVILIVQGLGALPSLLPRSLGRSLAVIFVAAWLALAATGLGAFRDPNAVEVERFALMEDWLNELAPDDLVVLRRTLALRAARHALAGHDRQIVDRDYAAGLAGAGSRRIFVLTAEGAEATREVESHLASRVLESDRKAGGWRLRRFAALR
ncbi:MAG: hypothetical protein KDB53_21325 [Planctomycetes bacterium]|nr:hypothetical protein [Planctomycetota bacterium]